MRSIVITGGGTGIGRAVAGHFRSTGERVHIIGRRESVLQTAAAEIGATSVVGDLSTSEGVSAVIAGLPDRIDVLVNIAGGNTDFDARTGLDTPSLAAVADSWQANWAANVLTAVLTTTALADRINDGGRVISFSSIAAPQGSGSYGAAKAALESWNVGLAKELGGRGITANVVSPGLIDDTEFFRGQLSDERRERLIAATDTGRPGVPDDIVAVVGFLAASGSRHLTGQVLHVNGGAYTGR